MGTTGLPSGVVAALPTELHGLRFHDLRHSAASTLIQAGVNAKQIADRLGHSSVSITFDRYGHLMRGHDDELVERLDQMRAAAAAQVVSGASGTS